MRYLVIKTLSLPILVCIFRHDFLTLAFLTLPCNNGFCNIVSSLELELLDALTDVTTPEGTDDEDDDERVSWSGGRFYKTFPAKFYG
jgi:hypothetical protein